MTTDSTLPASTTRIKVYRLGADTYRIEHEDAAEWDEKFKRAVEAFKKPLLGVPFYKAVEHDWHFWTQYLGSRMCAVHELIGKPKVRIVKLDRPAASTDSSE